ncbi:unnamed protein product [Lepeophtheirus salmonis]|nr:unnamed protein product [Lepeophtheirus salmonis]CAF2842793.1 unnamed protein product [Lepeophtheirus salmonis]
MRYSKYITKKLDMEKKYSLKDKSVLLLNSLNHDFITKIYEEIKNCGAKCIDILENIVEIDVRDSKEEHMEEDAIGQKCTVQTQTHNHASSSLFLSIKTLTNDSELF